jgi:hypothetical protein
LKFKLGATEEQIASHVGLALLGEFGGGIGVRGCKNRQLSGKGGEFREMGEHLLKNLDIFKHVCLW